MANILVLGDLMLDVYICGSVDRISPEAPIPVVKYDSEKIMLGGCGNVVQNLVDLGRPGLVQIGSVVGNDKEGLDLLSLLNRVEINVTGVFLSTERKTTTKTRIVAGTQQVVRLDKESIHDLDYPSVLSRHIENIIDEIGLIVISDYGKGIITKELMDHIKSLAVERNIKIIADIKPQNKYYYEDIFCVTPNRKEAEAMVGYKITSAHDQIYQTGRNIIGQLGCEYALITLGSHGMSLCSAEDYYHVETTAQEVYDVSGAGDTVLATLALGIMGGMDIEDAVYVANVAAGIAVSKAGTASVTKAELLKGLKNNGNRIHQWVF